MTRDELCALALRALDEPETRLVLADAIEESGWWDPRVLISLQAGSMVPEHNFARDPAHLHRWLHGAPGWDFSATLGIVAVMLFGDWPTTWELALACRVPYRPPGAALVRIT